MPFDTVVLIAIVVLFGAFMAGLAWGQWRSSSAGTWAEEKRAGRGL